MRVASIDIGTNTTRLLVAETTRSASAYRELERRLEYTRLGEGVDAAGRIASTSLKRTLEVIADFCALCGEFQVDRVRVAATSAVRDAANRDEFLSAVGRLAGTGPEMLEGGDEARLSFVGATSDLASGRYLVCDIGGGSTEFFLGRVDDGEVIEEGSVSLDVGSVRLTERILDSDPPSAGELDQLEQTIDDHLAEARSSLSGAEGASFIGVAGTVTSLAALNLKLNRYDPGRTHHATLSSQDVESQYRRLASMPLASRRKIAVLPPARADVIVAGAAILHCSMKTWAFSQVLVSERDILDGLVIEMIRVRARGE